MLLPWTTLQPSSRALVLRRVGIGLALGSCAALAAAAFAADPFNPVPALLSVAGGLISWVLVKRRSNQQFEVGVSSTAGGIAARVSKRKRAMPDTIVATTVTR